jgi:hypothetical protein
MFNTITNHTNKSIKSSLSKNILKLPTSLKVTSTSLSKNVEANKMIPVLKKNDSQESFF